MDEKWTKDLEGQLGAVGHPRARPPDEAMSTGVGSYGCQKSSKGTRDDKPPEAATGHSDIEDWFGRLMPNLQPILRSLDEAIRAAIPGLNYAVKYNRAFYGLPELGGYRDRAL